MLVLSRKEGEEIVIDGNITITIKRIAGHRISIGVAAPPDVGITRGELQGQIAQNQPLRRQLERAVAAPV